MDKPTVHQIVSRIVENGRASTNEELENQFEFDANEAGYSDDEIKNALASKWFPWISAR